jgi:hypothetical protein
MFHVYVFSVIYTGCILILTQFYFYNIKERYYSDHIHEHYVWDNYQYFPERHNCGNVSRGRSPGVHRHTRFNFFRSVHYFSVIYAL